MGRHVLPAMPKMNITLSVSSCCGGVVNRAMMTDTDSPKDFVAYTAVTVSKQVL